MSLRYYIYIAFLLFYNHSLYAVTPQLEINEHINSYTDFEVSYFEEAKNSSLSIKDITKLDMKNRSSNSFTLGYTVSPVWFKFDIVNKSSNDKDMILELSEMFHRTVDLFVVSPSFVKHEKNGLNVRIQDRKIEEINPSFNLKFKAGEVKHVYIKLETHYPTFGALYLKTPERYYKDTRIRNYMIIFYFGAIVIIALYNLFIFFYLRDKIYFFYVTYVLFFTVWVTLYKGFISYFVDAEMFDIIQLSLPGFFIMFILFSQSLLGTKKQTPRTHFLLNIFIVLLLFSVIGLLTSFQNGFYFINIIITPLLITLLITAILISKEDSRVPKLYFVVLFIYFIGISLVSMLALRVVPYHPYIVNSPLLGSFLEITFFSLLLAYRINLSREETLLYQSKLLKQESSESIRLSEMVDIKTNKLNELNTKLAIELEEKKKLEKILLLKASTDSLTGILNRRSFFETCAKEVQITKRYKHNLSFIIIDIDYFKNINDTYGHLNGDIVLNDIVYVIKNTIRTTDVFGRIGGEEFAVLMPETKQEDAVNLAERIRKNIAVNESILEDNIINVTVSIGLSFMREEDAIIQTVLRRADLALFKAKERGRNQLCCLDET